MRDPRAGFNVLNPAELHARRRDETATQDINDHEWGIGANLTVPAHYTDRADEQFKFGVNARLREKTGD